jgi:hypothetical protein
MITAASRSVSKKSGAVQRNQQRDAGEAGDSLLEKFELFGVDLGRSIKRHSGDVTTRAGQA